MKTIILSTILLLISAVRGVTQQSNLNLFYKESQRINRNGFVILGTVSLANLVTGAIGSSKANGEAKYFHRMNMYWGSVNLAVSGVAYLTLKKRTAPANIKSALLAQAQTEKIFLFNTGLDLAYMAGGLYLHEKANFKNNPAKYRGYGNSVILQGGLLFLFDGAMYLMHSQHGKGLYKVVETMSVAPNSIGFVIKL
jgi:hypothetical protein